MQTFSLREIVDVYVANISERLLREMPEIEQEISHVVENQWHCQKVLAGFDVEQLTPDQAYALEAMRSCAKSNASPLMLNYAICLKRRSPLQRLLGSDNCAKNEKERFEKLVVTAYLKAANGAI